MVVVEPNLSSEIDSGDTIMCMSDLMVPSRKQKQSLPRRDKAIEKENILTPTSSMIFHDCNFNNCTFPNNSIAGGELEYKEEKGDSDSENENDSLFSEALALFEKCDFDL